MRGSRLRPSNGRARLIARYHRREGKANGLSPNQRPGSISTQLDFFAALQSSQTYVGAVDLDWTTFDVPVQCVSPQFKRGSFLGVVYLAAGGKPRR